MERKVWSALLAGMVLAGPAAAQERSTGGDLKHVPKDAWFIVSAPVHASAHDLETLGLLTGAAGVALLLDEPVHDWLHSDPFVARALRPFGTASPVSIVGRTWFFLLPLSTALYGAGHAFDSTDLRDAGLGCATANLTTTLTRTVTSLLVGRLRPGMHAGAFRFELFAFGGWDQRSFPGGHTSNVMSCASFFNNRFDLGVAEPAIFALAGGVGAARIIDEAHWLSDTVVGMSYGYAVGRNIADRFAGRASQQGTEQSLQPGIRIRWKITF